MRVKKLSQALIKIMNEIQMKIIRADDPTNSSFCWTWSVAISPSLTGCQPKERFNPFSPLYKHMECAFRTLNSPRQQFALKGLRTRLDVCFPQFCLPCLCQMLSYAVTPDCQGQDSAIRAHSPRGRNADPPHASCSGPAPRLWWAV